MAQLLGIKGDISRDERCISCHGVVVGNNKVDDSFSLAEGVSCVVCHGPHAEWVGPHGLVLERKKWRGLSRQVKEEKYGMTDLWDPLKRAALCASCHVGNAAEGKVVTHAMYAAGHPPLPGFEAATFSDAMPRHWQYLREKDPAVQKILERDPERGQLEQTELVVYSSLASLRASLQLLATQAEADNAGSAWPELAQFDCYACHHDLKAKSWRQQRGYGGRPGRPPMRAWPTALTPLALRHAAVRAGDAAAPAQQFRRHLMELTDAFDAQPFGDPKAVAASARKLLKWVDDFVPQVRANRFDEPAARRLLVELGAIPQEKLLDYDSARQVAWAFKTVFDDIHAEGSPVRQNKDVQSLFNSLEKQLQLTLPVGRVRIVDFSAASLRKLNDYEPDPFRNTMRRLVQEATAPRK
jgi:hypothetical protein